MRLLARFVLLAGLVWMSGACNSYNNHPRVIIIQPFADLPGGMAESVYESVKAIHPNTLLRPAIPLPESAYYPPRSRYRADRIISFLHKSAGSNDSILIGLTGKDISTSKDGRTDWGIMGLAYEPGNACVVSSFRLSKPKLKSQLYKVTIHELGHAHGLPHCADKSCFMRSAEGGNPTDEEYHFCRSCKAHLRARGWVL